MLAHTTHTQINTDLREALDNARSQGLGHVSEVEATQPRLEQGQIRKLLEKVIAYLISNEVALARINAASVKPPEPLFKQFYVLPYICVLSCNRALLNCQDGT